MFKAGDKVKVVEPTDRSESPIFTFEMNVAIGRKYTINRNIGDNMFTLKEINYNWLGKWLVPCGKF